MKRLLIALLVVILLSVGFITGVAVIHAHAFTQFYYVVKVTKTVNAGIPVTATCTNGADTVMGGGASLSPKPGRALVTSRPNVTNSVGGPTNNQWYVIYSGVSPTTVSVYAICTSIFTQ